MTYLGQLGLYISNPQCLHIFQFQLDIDGVSSWSLVKLKDDVTTSASIELQRSMMISLLYVVGASGFPKEEACINIRTNLVRQPLSDIVLSNVYLLSTGSSTVFTDLYPAQSSFLGPILDYPLCMCACITASINRTTSRPKIGNINMSFQEHLYSGSFRRI